MTAVAKRGIETAADLLDRIQHLGSIPPYRVLLRPTPGEATEADLLSHAKRTKRLCELVDGVLVEKATGYGEACLAGWLVMCLSDYLLSRDLGCLAGAGGTVRLRKDLVRAPCLSFLRWDKLPNGQFDMRPIGRIIPDLAIEIIRAGNTKAEFERKIGEYFCAGVQAVWIVDHFHRVVVVHTSADDFVALKETDTLDGGTVFPGLDLPLARIFEVVPPTKKRTRRKKL